MDKSTEPTNVAGPSFRLVDGLTVLEHWADSASQAKKNAVYRALFAVTDGTVLRDYVVFPDVRSPGELSVLLKEDLVLRIALRGQDAFAIRYVGSAGYAPDPTPVITGQFDTEL